MLSPWVYTFVNKHASYTNAANNKDINKAQTNRQAQTENISTISVFLRMSLDKYRQHNERKNQDDSLVEHKQSTVQSEIHTRTLTQTPFTLQLPC